MKYPNFMRIINKTLAMISAAMFMIIAVLTVFEVIARNVFHAPTVWSNDVMLYLLIWAFFMGSGFAYQEKGIPGVDLVRDAVEKRWGKKPRRVISIIGYIITLIVLIMLLYGAILLTKRAIDLKQLTLAFIQIPSVYLWFAVIVGSIITSLTIVCIILNLFSKEEKYL